MWRNGRRALTNVSRVRESRKTLRIETCRFESCHQHKIKSNTKNTLPPMKNEAHTLSVWRNYRFSTRHEADIFQKAFKLEAPLREFDERIGQTVFVFQW